MTGLGVDQRRRRHRFPTGREPVGVGVDPDLDGAGELAGVVGAVKQVLSDVGVALAAHLRRHGVNLNGGTEIQ